MKLSILVKPRSKKVGVEILPNGSLKVMVKESPVEGKANEAVRRLLADHFSVPITSVRVIAGKSGRKKIIEV